MSISRCGNRHIVVQRLDQLIDRLVGRVVAGVLKGRERAALDHRRVIAGEAVLGQQLADFHLDELEQFGIVHEIDLVEEADDLGHADLAGEQDVLARLGHRPVGRGDHQNRAVHLGGAGDHVLDVVGVARTVHVGIVPRV